MCVAFPAAYRAFLRRVGPSCESLLGGSDVGPPDDLTRQVRERLDGDALGATEPEDSPGATDPEGDSVQQVTGSFTGLLRLTVEDETSLARDGPE